MHRWILMRMDILRVTMHDGDSNAVRRFLARIYCSALRGPSGMVRSMNWSNKGTVKAVSPCAGL